MQRRTSSLTGQLVQLKALKHHTDRPRVRHKPSGHVTGREVMYLLSLSRLRISSLNVSLFFSTMPLTSYTTCNTSQGGDTFSCSLSRSGRRTRKSCSYLSCIVSDSKEVHGDARLHIERVFLQPDRGNVPLLLTNTTTTSATLPAAAPELPTDEFKRDKR